MQINPSMPTYPSWDQPHGMSQTEYIQANLCIAQAMIVAGKTPSQRDKLPQLESLLNHVTSHWRSESLNDVKKQVNAIMGWHVQPDIPEMNQGDRIQGIIYAMSNGFMKLDSSDPKYEIKLNELAGLTLLLLTDDAYAEKTSLSDFQRAVDKIVHG